MEDNMKMALRSHDKASTVPCPEVVQVEADKRRVDKLANEVFSQDLLLEKILKYAIHQNNNLSRPTICTTRLVQQRWLQTVTKLVGKDKEPLFNLVLNKTNSINGAKYVREKGKLLDQFVDSFTITSRDTSSGYVPTFSVKIMEHFFRQENLDSFSDFLRRCGPGMLKLEMFVPLNGGSLPGLLSPTLSLPLLKKLTVHLTNAQLENLSPDEKNFKDSGHITYFLYSLLNCLPNLTEFELPFNQNSELPSNFQRLLLPASLTKFTLLHPWTSPRLQLLSNNALPNLSLLDLTVPNVASDGEYLFRVLDSVRTSLKKLCLRGLQHEGPPKSITSLRLPVMEKLQRFLLLSIHCELDSRMTSSLEKYLPNLCNFFLRDQTEEMFRKWTATSKYTSVRRVGLKLVDEGEEYDDADYLLSLNLENMQRLHMAFPNVRILYIEMSSLNTCGLKYMFMEMRQLVVLKIVFTSAVEQRQDSDFWDALFTGTTPEIIAAFRASPEFWEIVDIKNEDMPSLRMLTNLTRILLETQHLPNYDGGMPPLNSDLLFHLALLKMPKLKDLTFKGRFVVSDRVRELCQTQNKTLH